MSENSVKGSPFDLHVLSTPPAFILSQDQTLNKMVSKQQPKLLSKSLSLIAKSSFQEFKEKERCPTKLLASWTTCLVRLVLRVSLTLFNLQGARRYLFETGLLYFSTTFRLCQEDIFLFSSAFFLFLRDSFNNIPPSPRFVKYFFHFFANVWVVILNAKGQAPYFRGASSLPHLFFYTTNHDKPQ